MTFIMNVRNRDDQKQLNTPFTIEEIRKVVKILKDGKCEEIHWRKFIHQVSYFPKYTELEKKVLNEKMKTYAQRLHEIADVVSDLEHEE